jgi:hypothetical protein
MKAKNRFLRGIILRFFSFVFLIAPFGVLTYLKRETWFISGANKISFGMIVMLIFVACLLGGAFKTIDKRINTIITLGVFALVTWFLAPIMVDITWILIAALVGYLIFLIFSIFADKDLNYHKEYVSEHARVEARKEAQEESNPYSAM